MSKRKEDKPLPSGADVVRSWRDAIARQSTVLTAQGEHVTIPALILCGGKVMDWNAMMTNVAQAVDMQAASNINTRLGELRLRRTK